MKCHCTEVEELRVENDLLRTKAQETWDCACNWEARWQEADHKRELAEAKLAKIEALIQREEERMAAGPVLFDGSHFPAVVTAGELREVLDA